MRITEEEQEIRRNRMLHAAYELFCEYGIDGVSLMQIAKAADVSQNSLYRYFDNKPSLVQSTQIILWEEIANCIRNENMNELQKSKNGLEEISVLLYGFKNLYQNYSHYILFSGDYKQFLLRNNIVLSKQQQEIMMTPIRVPFIEAIKKGHLDGSINTNQSPENQFYTAWGILRGYVEEIVVYDKIYSGKNPLQGHFEVVLKHVIGLLKSL